MKIERENILKAFKLFSDIYSDFNKRFANSEDLRNLLKEWEEIFEVIKFDYKEANEDFLKAIKILITKCKYTPTIAEIIAEIRTIWLDREAKRVQNLNKELIIMKSNLKLEDNAIERSFSIFETLRKKYSLEQVKDLIKAKIVKYSELYINDISYFLQEIYEETTK